MLLWSKRPPSSRRRNAIVDVLLVNNERSLIHPRPPHVSTLVDRKPDAQAALRVFKEVVMLIRLAKTSLELTAMGVDDAIDAVKPGPQWVPFGVAENHPGEEREDDENECAAVEVATSETNYAFAIHTP